MKEKKLSSDASEWAYERFIKDDPEMQEFLWRHQAIHRGKSPR